MDPVYMFAGVAVRVEDASGYIRRRCSGYESCETPEFTVRLTRENIEYERSLSDDPAAGDDYLSFLALYRAFCDAAAEKHVILFRSSAVAGSRRLRALKKKCFFKNIREGDNCYEIRYGA